MGNFRNRLANLVAMFTEQINWRCEQVDGVKAFSGRFFVFDRRGRISSRVPGRIVQRNARVAEVYLWDPPRFVLEHKHGRCLQLLTPNDKWFKLHFEKPASNFADAYTYVEHLLTEAFNLSPHDEP